MSAMGLRAAAVRQLPGIESDAAEVILELLRCGDVHRAVQSREWVKHSRKPHKG
jgi:hypothetical protein